MGDDLTIARIAYAREFTVAPCPVGFAYHLMNEIGAKGSYCI